ncbi:aminotransferase class I/II-fold pyridoxal phosphate-dependent enzyme [Marinicrinis sediminis]|uniref:Aminotransferase class I/II-fold pyridoxal phosphate-dependent enzyme n=1 Tax=Marinicrinis sediminis TaxID=1652465 RepID=A0ABW5R943_9BACL
MNLNQHRAPILEALLHHQEKQTASFHVPGHKNDNQRGHQEDSWFTNVMKLDMTELTGLDDLHEPSGCIAQAQQLAASAFGASHTWFLVGGSTVGNLSVICAWSRPGDIWIVDRHAHKSVMNALKLVEARVAFLPARFHPQTGIPVQLDVMDIEHMLKRYPQARGVLITSPTYYGYQSDLKAIADRVHHYGMPLIVDEAHGAHFSFHPSLPQSAMQAGADVAIQSTHKMLGAMTMSAMLHLQGNRIDPALIRQALGMLQSSSPSYPLMASLDVARRDAALHGYDLLQVGMQQLQSLSEQIEGIEGIGILRADDPFKMYVYDKTRSLNGHQLREQLELRGCMMELADETGVLAVHSLYTKQGHLGRLRDSLQAISEKYRLGKQELKPSVWNTYSTPLCMEESAGLIHFQNNLHAPSQLVDLEMAEGYRAAEMVIPYPPGVPLWVQGERITRASLEALVRWVSHGGHVQGLDAAGSRIRVLAETPSGSDEG